MFLKFLITLFAVVNLITFASSGSSSESDSEDYSSFESSFEDDVNSVKDDIYSIFNDSSDTGSDFPSLASDIESLEDDFAPLVLCHQMHPFPFQDCYRDISVMTTKKANNFTDEEFKDYKCELLYALTECINIKTRIYCGDTDGELVKELTDIFKPQYNMECNQTGIIKSHLVQFSI